MSLRDSTLEWLVIGGGIHGSYIANCLIRKRFTSRSDLRVLDPNGHPLARWKRVTSNTGMKYLRSPKVHNLDMEPFALKHFARCRSCDEDLFIAPNERPSLSLFNRHADSVLEQSRLQELFIRNRAVEIERAGDRYLVHTGNDVIKANRILLAVGRGDHPEWPPWADRVRKEGGRIDHVLCDTYFKDKVPAHGEIVVVGGGMSAVQTALSIADEKRHVTLLSPHSLRQNNYDSDPGWMGPKYLNRFRKISCYRKRRYLIDEARNSGTITHDLKRELIMSKNRNECRVAIDRVKSCSVLTDDLMLLNLKSGETLAANHIVLATGYENRRPGGDLINGLISNYRLRCSECGFPITDTSLQWHNRLFVSGALAELEVGPASQNIIGARMAAEKIMYRC